MLLEEMSRVVTPCTSHFFCSRRCRYFHCYLLACTRRSLPGIRILSGRRPRVYARNCMYDGYWSELGSFSCMRVCMSLPPARHLFIGQVPRGRGKNLLYQRQGCHRLQQKEPLNESRDDNLALGAVINCSYFVFFLEQTFLLSPVFSSLIFSICLLLPFPFLSHTGVFFFLYSFLLSLKAYIVRISFIASDFFASTTYFLCFRH